MTKPRKTRAVLADSLSLNRRNFDCRGVSPVIAVILMVAITVVLAAVLYVMVVNMLPDSDITPIGHIYFKEDSAEQGKYIGEFRGSVNLYKTEIIVYDTSEDESMILRPALETQKGSSAGMNLTYGDVNENEKLDAADTLLLNGGESGDKITIMWVPTGEPVATHILK